MKKIIGSLLLACSLVVSTALPAKAMTPDLKQTWAWSASQIDNPTGFVQGMKDANINTVYLNTGWDVGKQEFYFVNHPEVYDLFIQEANANGIKVEALLSNNDWTLTANYAAMEREIKNVLNFNATHINRISAVHLDIEPYALSTWNRKKTSLLQQYVANLQSVKVVIDQHNVAYNDDVNLVIDIPWWFIDYSVERRVNLIDTLAKTVDQLSIMNYTQNVDLFTTRGVDILAIVDKYPGKTVTIGTEFQPDYTDVTWYGKTKEQVDLNYTNALAQFELYSSFEALSVHTYEAYTNFLVK